MLVTLFRAIILYVAVIFSVRLMGKRQVGELQPSELVITILVSEIAAIPLQDNSIPIINSIIALLLLVAFEVIASFISMKSQKFRSVMQGNPLIIIRDGVLDQKLLKEMRFTVDDILEALREKDVFDISEVQYAIIETTGMISVLLKSPKKPLTPDILNIEVQDNGFPYTVVTDGKIIDTYLDDCHLTSDSLKSKISRKGLKLDEVFFMSIDKNGRTNIIKKDRTN